MLWLFGDDKSFRKWGLVGGSKSLGQWRIHLQWIYRIYIYMELFSFIAVCFLDYYLQLSKLCFPCIFLPSVPFELTKLWLAICLHWIHSDRKAACFCCQYHSDKTIHLIHKDWEEGEVLAVWHKAGVGYYKKLLLHLPVTLSFFKS